MAGPVTITFHCKDIGMSKCWQNIIICIHTRTPFLSVYIEEYSVNIYSFKTHRPSKRCLRKSNRAFCIISVTCWQTRHIRQQIVKTNSEGCLMFTAHLIALQWRPNQNHRPHGRHHIIWRNVFSLNKTRVALSQRTTASTKTTNTRLETVSVILVQTAILPEMHETSDIILLFKAFRTVTETSAIYKDTYSTDIRIVCMVLKKDLTVIK